MVSPNTRIDLFDFQEQTVNKLLDLVVDPAAKQTILIKSPTGSGKTIILISFVDEYLTYVSNDVAFIWFCPGKGELEEQSRKKMQDFAPWLETQSLNDALTTGFRAGSTTFVNWELVTKRGNKSLQDSEKKNLFDRIADAHREGTKFIVIIDEEHLNNTSKANDIINAFSATHIIRVSATAKENKRFEFIEIDELDVINAGLITKAVYVNEGMTDNQLITNDYDLLLNLADNKRKDIAARYKRIGKNIRPLVLIQFPNGQPKTIEDVEQKLESMGYTYANGMVSKWMSEDKKDLTDDLVENNGQPVFLLMKQAISTGWDCPRAKILVKLREGMSETFTIQTVGRIRRMPETVHYDDDLLDFCYVYTLDEKYKAGLFEDIDKAYETRRLFLKEKCKTFTLEKELRDLDYGGVGERDVLKKLHEYLVKKYKLTGDVKERKRILQEAGYIFGNEILGQTMYGEYVHTDSLQDSTNFYTTRRRVSTHEHGMQLLHAMDTIKTTVGISNAKVKTILERLFKKSLKTKYKILNLPVGEFYAFVINNERQLRHDFNDATAEMGEQTSFVVSPKKAIFKIPEEDLFRYDPDVKNEIDYLSNAYYEYTSGFATTVVRSICEVLFEQYCEASDDIEWVYKNGDSGQQYFSIVYLDGLQNQWLFYADYIVKKKDDTVWVIETKGGESHGEDKNIDEQVPNKFYAFKEYAENKNINWGFVRDKDNRLYINNTEYAEDMSDDNWRPLEDNF